ncbi:MAG: hypothetical protein JW782_07550 [Candidatus Saganbacteria bacterium]|nr:hypothetical protein [Candidatus Saganbacteria bacterium]
MQRYPHRFLKQTLLLFSLAWAAQLCAAETVYDRKIAFGGPLICGRRAEE